MKNFTRFLLFFVLFAIASTTYAQVTFGLRLGANFSKQKFEIEGEDGIDNMKMLPGGNLGFVLNIPVSDPFSIETGLLLNTKGYRAKESNDTSKYVAYNYLAYVDLPINAKYTFDLGGPKFYLTAGPYFAFGIYGKGGSKTTDDNDHETTEEWDFEWGGEGLLNHKRLDIGFNVGGGFQFGSFVIGANYGIGLKNIATLDGLTVKNKVLSFSIGANFGN